MSDARKVTAVWARQIAELLDARRQPADLILREVGLSREELAPPDARIDFAKHVALIEIAAERLNDRCFGLHFGASLDPLDAGAVGYLAANSPTLNAAIENYVKYLATATEGFRVHLDREPQRTRVVVEMIDPEVTRRQQCYELALASTINISRFVVGRRFAPAAVEMQHQRDSDLDEFRRYFGKPVAFGSGRYAVIFDQAQLTAPCRSADERLFRIVKAHCDALLEKSRKATEFREEVEHLVAALLPTGTATTKHVAATLAMSDRTLARRLAEEGTSFREILERQRHAMALEYLSDSAVRPSQIAYLLGYSEPSAFTHAFRRWTGCSPAEYRTQRSTAAPAGN